ncbi:MAG: pilin [Patescibacteria group bacterium]
MKVNKKYLFLFSLIFSLLVFVPKVLAIDVGLDNVDDGIALGGSSPITIATRIINILLLLLGIIAVGLTIYAGFVWMTSEGNEEKVDKAKKLLRNAVIGLVIVLSSWGIATFVLGKIMDATGNGNGDINNPSCTVGQTRPCGFNDSCVQTCEADGTWGACSGVNCNPNEGQDCDLNSLEEGCQAGECAVGFRCGDDCKCVSDGDLGDACDADGDNEDGQCTTPDDSRCGPYLSCDVETCTCQGTPVITAVSPVGGFCKTDVNQACNTDADCPN